MLKTLEKIFYGYLMNIVIVSGTFGNILSIIVWSSKNLRRSTTSRYLSALGVVDNLVLLTAIFRYKTYRIFINDVSEEKAVSEVEPYFEVYVEPFHWISLGLSSFYLVALTVERYLVVKFSLKIKPYCTINVPICVLLTITLAVVLLTIPTFLDYEIRRVHFEEWNITTIEIFPTEFKKNQIYTLIFHDFLIPILWYIVPWCILAVCNFLLVRHIKESAKVSLKYDKTH